MKTKSNKKTGAPLKPSFGLGGVVQSCRSSKRRGQVEDAPLKPSFGLGGVVQNRHSKRRGQVAELAFMHHAADLGFVVTKPYGETEPYDFILDSGRCLWRVQVKSTEAMVRRRHRYYVQPEHCRAGRARRNYSSEEIDFLVAYVVPARAWYVIPVGALGSRTTIYLYPDSPRSRGGFERYRDAWCQMACPDHGLPHPEIRVHRFCDSENISKSQLSSHWSS